MRASIVIRTRNAPRHPGPPARRPPDRPPSTGRGDRLRYRWNRYVGSYKGNHEHKRLSRTAKKRHEAIGPLSGDF